MLKVGYMKERLKMIDINKDGVFLTPNKWTYEERSLYEVDNHYCFEKNYSKWAYILIEKFINIMIYCISLFMKIT